MSASCHSVTICYIHHFRCRCGSQTNEHHVLDTFPESTTINTSRYTYVLTQHDFSNLEITHNFKHQTSVIGRMAYHGECGVLLNVLFLFIHVFIMSVFFLIPSSINLVD